MYRRAVIAGLVGLLSLAILAPFSGFDPAAIYTWLVFAALYVPPWERIPLIGRYIPALGLLAVVVTYPFYNDKLYTLPILGSFPDIHTGVVMLIFVMMAVGLNIVVGYAGLLDLGYVAFYALGAYSAGWLASDHFTGVGGANKGEHVFSSHLVANVPGIHLNFLLVLVAAIIICAVSGAIL